MGLWLTTWHKALAPQTPGQGSWHFWLMQALSWVQSEFLRHSGWQFGGLPKYPGWHSHTGLGPRMVQMEYGPQGLGTQEPGIGLGFLG